MMFQRYRFRWSWVAAIAAVVGAALLYGSLGGVRIETDILSSLPPNDPVLADARRVIGHLPYQNRLIVDVEIRAGEREDLIEAGETVERALRASGLFRQVGMEQMEALFPELMEHIVGHLPLFFDGGQLEKEVAPLLATDRVRRVVEENLKVLQGLEGLGQAGLIARDPLGLRNLVLERISRLAPARGVRFQGGKLLSPDERHLLVVAELKGEATDAASSRAIPPLIRDIERQLEQRAGAHGARFTLTPSGVYRAALDNETVARRDMRRAVLMTVAGIGLLLIASFPRPLIGLMALIPSTVGAVFALLFCSLIFPSLSILAVSFGGAVMAFTVDLGIAYLLFLDRPFEVPGRRAAREVRAPEILAVLTTIGGFLLLALSPFGVLAQIGVFAAVGVAVAYAFVHWVFPRMLPVMPPALKPRNPWLNRGLDRIALSGGKASLAAVALFFGTMLLFARPVFQVDINAMNSMNPDTVAADQTIRRVWGDMASRVYLMTEGQSLAELQVKGDRLAVMLQEDIDRGVIRGAFALSDLYPGETLAGRHASDWKAFWANGRAAALERELAQAIRDTGFARDAFRPFLNALEADPPPAPATTPKFAAMIGVSGDHGAPAHISAVTPGPEYEAEAFFARYSKPDLASLFDAGLFNRRLGEVLVSLFTKTAVITGLGVALVVFFFFLQWRLFLIVLAPVVFALVCTLGSMKLLGRPVDIPGIMLWIVVMCMGIDYAIYYVCAYQRYLDERHPSMTLIRQAMFLSGATTLIGFGVLAFAGHAVLRSIGLTSLLGISYSLAGTFLIVPPLVKRAFLPAELPPEVLDAGSVRHTERTLLRYRNAEATPRLFARWKIRLDPMFPHLAAFMKQPRRILDVGCGYGIPSSWLLELFPDATVSAIEPDEERVRVAGRTFGRRGEVRTGRAPELDPLPDRADTALVLDVIHMLDDEALRETLRILHEKLVPGGRLVIRATVPAERPRTWKPRIEDLRLKIHRMHPHYRTRARLEATIAAAGFGIVAVEADAPESEVWWFVADRDASGGGTP